MKKLLLPMLMASALAACGSHKGDQFVGRWQDVADPKTSYEIHRNGDSFMLTHDGPGFTGPHEHDTFPATLNGDTLTINNGFGSISVAIDQSTGNLVVDNKQAKKIS